jgi:hypothetical protein
LTKEELIPRKFRIVNANELANFLSTQEIVIRAYHDAQIIDYARNMDGDVLPGRFDLYDCTQRVLQHERNNKQRGVKGNVAHVACQMEVAKLQALKAKTERELMQNQIFFGGLLRREDVMKEWNDLVLAIRSKLMSFSSLAARKVLGLEDYKSIVEVLNNEMERCADDLANLDDDGVDKILQRDKKNTKVRDALKSGNSALASDGSDID